MTQSQLKTYMMNYLKNQGDMEINLQSEEMSLKKSRKSFDKLEKQALAQKDLPKKAKMIMNVEEKDDEPTKKSGRRKQMARKGMHTSVDKNDSEHSDEVGEHEESNTDDLRLSYTRIVMHMIWDEMAKDKLEKGYFGNVLKE
ncbi:hypothetical protein Tco_1104553 [Tanacetum coccineum]